ncbi:MAG: AraC family transcriptional regulator [Candidatus Eremiobacteraeota bacterium]|nr:AraC family transcriptional regulator [Candidatus Eremiobacteraeota bacterium]
MDSIETDAPHAAEVVPGWRNGVVVPMEPGPLRLRSTVLHTPGVRLGRLEFSCGHRYHGSVPAETVFLAFPLTPPERIVFNGRHLDALSIVAGGPGREIELFSRVSGQHLVMSIRASSFGASSEAWSKRLGDEGWSPRSRSPEHRRVLVEFATSVLSAAQAAPSLARNATFHQGLERRLVRMLDVGISREGTVGNEPERRRAARAAQRYLASNLRKRISVAELCLVAGANERTLQRGFLETYGLTPKAYVVSRRLDLVRRQLLAPSEGTTVTAAATSVGFFHFGRFAEAYRRLFGESPSATLRRALEPSAVSVSGYPSRSATV